MNEILSLSDFHDGSNNNKRAYYYLSMHCNNTISEQIKLYCGPKYSIFESTNNSLTFPKIVYIDKFLLNFRVNIQNAYPDLREVGKFDCEHTMITELGNIVSIDLFFDMNLLLFPTDNFKPKLRCKPLGDKMYRFTSDKGSWDVRVNRYN